MRFERGHLFRPRRLVAVFLPAISLIGLAGCDRDKSETFDEIDKSLLSWSATLHVSGEQWSHEQVPAVYISQIGEAADKALAKQADTLAKVPASDQRWHDLNARLSRLRDLARQLQSAGDRDDPAAGEKLTLQPAEDQGGSPADGGRRP